MGDPVSATRAEFPLCPLRVDGWGHHGPPSSSCTTVTVDQQLNLAGHLHPLQTGVPWPSEALSRFYHDLHQGLHPGKYPEVSHREKALVEEGSCRGGRYQYQGRMEGTGLDKEG